MEFSQDDEVAQACQTRIDWETGRQDQVRRRVRHSGFQAIYDEVGLTDALSMVYLTPEHSKFARSSGRRTPAAGTRLSGETTLLKRQLLLPLSGVCYPRSMCIKEFRAGAGCADHSSQALLPPPSTVDRCGDQPMATEYVTA